MFRLLAVCLLFFTPALLTADDAAPKKKSYFGVQIARGKEEGTIVVLMVMKDSPAEKGEMKTGDVILKINDLKPGDLNATVQIIKSLKPNKKIKVLVKRDGKEKTLDVTPAEITDD